MGRILYPCEHVPFALPQVDQTRPLPNHRSGGRCSDHGDSHIPQSIHAHLNDRAHQDPRESVSSRGRVTSVQLQTQLHQHQRQDLARRRRLGRVPSNVVFVHGTRLSNRAHDLHHRHQSTKRSAHTQHEHRCYRWSPSRHRNRTTRLV